jgi:ribosome maturation factor RimP
VRVALQAALILLLGGFLSFMAGKNTVGRVEEIVKPFADALSLELWDITFTKEGTDWYLRIYIDKEGGVSIDDCVELTHAVTKPLDEADPISQSYMLEVSSPGVERELKKDAHFERYINSDVMLRTIRPIENVRDFNGVMTNYDNGNITVRLKDGKEITINKKDTSYVKLDDFDIADF